MAGLEAAVEQPLGQLGGLGHEHLEGRLREREVGARRVAHVALTVAPQRVVRADPARQRIARRRQVAVASVHQLRAQQEHQRGLPPPAVGVVGEGAPLVGRERSSQRRLDAREVSPAEELPRHVARERCHRHAMAAGHDRRRFLQRDQVAGPGVPVRHQDVPESGPGERPPVVDDRVADDPLAHADRSHRLEGEAPQRERRREDDRPPGPPRDEALGDRLGEVAGDEVVDADGQVRAVLLEGAHPDDRERPASVERVERRRRELFETEDAHRRRSRLSAGPHRAGSAPRPSIAPLPPRREAAPSRRRPRAGGSAGPGSHARRPASRGTPPSRRSSAVRIARRSARSRAAAWRWVNARTAKPVLRAEPVEAAEIVVGEETAQGQGDRERERPARPRDRPDEPGLEPPAEGEGDHAREEADRRVVGLLPRERAGEPAGDEIRKRVHDGAIEEDRKAEHGRAGRAQAVVRLVLPEPGSHRLVAHVPLGEQRAVVLDALPDPGEPVGIVHPEVGDRLDDGAGETEDVDRLGGKSPLGPELADELVPVQILDGTDHLGDVDPVDVDDLGLHRALDGVGQTLDGRHRLLARPRHVETERNRLPEGDEHPAPEGLPGLEGEPDRNQDERRSGVRTSGCLGGRSRRLVVESDPRRARLDSLDASLGVRGALGIDREHVAGGESLTGRGERLGVAIGPVRVVLPPVDGDGAGAGQEAGEDRVPEERGVGEVVDLPWQCRRDQERVDQVVGMVDAEENGAPRRDAPCLAHGHLAEEEPDPEARREPQEGVEAARWLGVLAHGRG